MIRRLGSILVLSVSLSWVSTAGADQPAVADLAKAAVSGSTKAKIEALDALTDLGSDAKAAVPQLTQALSDKDIAVRWHAARALGAIGSAAAPAADELAAALNDPNERVRAHAANALGEIGPDSKKYLPALIAKITDPNPQVRRHVIEAIAQIHPASDGDDYSEQIVAKISEALNNADPTIAVAAIKSLARYGKRTLPTAIKILEDSPPGSKARYWACVLLAEFGAEAEPAAKALGQTLKDEDAGVRMQAALTLSQIGPPAKAAVPALVEALSDKLGGVQYAAAYALGTIGDKRAVPALKKASFSNDTLVKTLSIWAIAKADPSDQKAVSKAVDAIIVAMEDKRPEVRQTAAQALWDLKAPHEKVGPALAKALNDDNPEVVAHVLDSLASLGAKIAPRVSEALADPKRRPKALALVLRMGPQAEKCVPALMKLIGETDDGLKADVMVSLAAIGPGAAPAAPAIAKQLDSQEPRVATAASYALGRMGTGAKSAIPEIEKQLKSDSIYTRVASAWALAQIDSDKARVAKQTLTLLTEALHSEIPLIRAEAASTLGSLGSAAKSTLPALTAAVNDPDSNVSRAAAAAIERIGK